MCGITGKIYFREDKNVTKEEIHRMNEKIAHRGPDDEGIYIKNNIGLGHRRLSIIDLSPAGHQPMSNEDETVWIVFNGEIYNFLQLRPELEEKGHCFKSNTDTEVIIHLYEDYGEECLQYLRGMFAFAIWDERKQKFFLARDRVGKKPLKYYIGKNFFVFASELKAFLNEPGVPKEMDLEAIHHYLTFQYVPHPMTGFKNIKKLPPAHYLTIDLSGNTPKIPEPIRYWKLNYSTKLNLTEQEWCERILSKLEECVKLRMISDVPLGAFLSGGIDSSAIVALMAKNSPRPVKTFSIGFTEKQYNELPYARLIAEQFGTEHTEFIVEPNAIKILPKLVYHYEEPYADSSALPTYYLSELTRQHVTVALNGDGGDENFAGYSRYVGYQISRFYYNLPSLIKKISLAGAAFSTWITRSNFFRKAYRFGQDCFHTPPDECFLNNTCYFNHQEKNNLYKERIQHRMKDLYSPRYLLDKINTLYPNNIDPLDKILCLDFYTYLPDDLMVKVDIASMAVALEARSPLLDHTLLEFTASMPPQLKLKGRETKYIFKKVLGEILPHEILYRKKKGFGVPLESWFRVDLYTYCQEILLDRSNPLLLLIKADQVQTLIQQHREGTCDHAYKIWALLTLACWLCTFFAKSENQYD